MLHSVRVPWRSALTLLLLAAVLAPMAFGQDAEVVSPTIAAAEAATAPAPPAGPTVGDLKVMIDTVWVLVAGFLVFFMNLGFATVESGFCRAKNCVNILSKNFIVFAVASIGF